MLFNIALSSTTHHNHREPESDDETRKQKDPITIRTYCSFTGDPFPIRIQEIRVVLLGGANSIVNFFLLPSTPAKLVRESMNNGEEEERSIFGRQSRQNSFALAEL